VLIANSVGANAVLAIKSQNKVNIPPNKNIAGINIYGFEVPNSSFVICGHAIPTKDIGPAKAVTLADNILDKNIRENLKAFIVVYSITLLLLLLE